MKNAEVDMEKDVIQRDFGVVYSDGWVYKGDGLISGDAIGIGAV